LIRDFKREWEYICEIVDTALGDQTLVFNPDNGMITLLGELLGEFYPSLIEVPMLAEHREIFRQACIGNLNGLIRLCLTQGK